MNYKILKNLLIRIRGNLPELKYCVAYVWRRMLIRTTIIAITGSNGKTTAKNCLGKILSADAPTIETLGTRNSLKDNLLASTVLRIRPWHRYAVLEVGTSGPGDMKRIARLISPNIVLILRIGRAHLREFRNLQRVADEKADLIKYPKSVDTVVLNGDDPYVFAMKKMVAGKLVTFGTSSSKGFNIWADEIISAWPDRLKFKLHLDKYSYDVQTQYLGRHWVPSVLGALATAQVCGVSMQKAIDNIKDILPYWARMQPIILPNGAIVIRDDWGCSIDTFDVALDVLREAKTKRKILVTTSGLSDTSKSYRKQASYVAKKAALTADFVIFIGEYSDRAKKVAISLGMNIKNVHSFLDWQKAINIIKSELREGDILLLKGMGSEHLSRIYLSLIGEVKCRLSKCGKMTLCDHCPELGFTWSKELDGLIARPLDMK